MQIEAVRGNGGLRSEHAANDATAPAAAHTRDTAHAPGANGAHTAPDRQNPAAAKPPRVGEQHDARRTWERVVPSPPPPARDRTAPDRLNP